MGLTLRDDTGLRSTKAPLTSAPDTDGSPSHSHVATARGEAGRKRYVVGVFVAPSAADDAIASLASGASEVLVISHSAPGRATDAAIEAGGRVSFHHIDTSGPFAPEFATMLGTWQPFAALGLSDRSGAGELRHLPGMQRLFQNLVHHPATGAAVIIVHAPVAEQQLLVSRALLEAKCDILLTHDVLQPPGRLEPAHPDECCNTCTSRSCGRIDPTPSDTSDAYGPED